MRAAIFRIDDSPMRAIAALFLGALAGLGLVWIIFSETELGIARWIAWASVFYLILLVSHILRRWRSGEPFLVASQTGLWLKDADSFGEIPWSDITAISKVPLAKAFELRLADRRKYLARLSPWRIGLAFNLLLFPKISVPLHFTGWNADEVVRVLHDLWAEHK